MGQYVVKTIVSVGFEPNLYRDEYVDAESEADAEKQVTTRLMRVLFDEEPDSDTHFICYRGFRPESKRPVYNYVRKSEIVYFYVSRIDELEH
jgi:hypothetical protein